MSKRHLKRLVKFNTEKFLDEFNKIWSVDKNKLEETDTVNENNFTVNDANEIQQFLED